MQIVPSKAAAVAAKRLHASMCRP